MSWQEEAQAEMWDAIAAQEHERAAIERAQLEPIPGDGYADGGNPYTDDELGG